MDHESQRAEPALDGASSEASEQELLLHLSDGLIAAPAASIDAAIEAALRDVGRFTGAFCCYIMQKDAAAESFACTHQWVAEGAEPTPRIPSVRVQNRLPRLLERLQHERVVTASEPVALPPEAAVGCRLLDEEGHKAIAAASLEGESNVRGLLVAEGVDAESEVETDLLLRRASQLLASVLRRQSIDAQATTEEERSYCSLFEKAGVPVLILRPADATILDANPAAARVYGVSEDELRGHSLKAFADEAYQEALAVARAFQQGTAENVEVVHCRADGTPMQMLVNCTSIRYQGEEAALCCLSDITAQKNAEHRLRESEERWRALVESHPEPILISVDAEIRYINEAGVATLGAEQRSDLIGRSIFDMVAPEYHKRFRARKDEIEEGQETTPLEHRLLRIDGAERIAVSYSTPIMYEGKRAAQTVIRDVTEQRMAERRFRDLLESAPDAMVIVNEEGRILLANKQTERIFGYEREELLGEPLGLLLPEAFRDRHAERVRHFFANPEARPMGTGLELYALRKDGTEFPVEIGLSPIETSDGLLVTSTIRDVTEQKKAEQALRRSRQRWRSLVEHHPNAVFITIDGEVQYANPATASLFGADESDALIGRSVFEFLLDEVHATIRNRIAMVERGEPTPALQHPLIGCDGVARIVEVSSVPIVYKGQEAVQTVGRDVTEQHRYEERLVEAKDEAERARRKAEEMNRLKSAFLANMSHEVRTPLASIIGFAEALSNEVKPASPSSEEASVAVEFAELIQQSGHRLLTTLNSVLDLSSLEAGTMGLNIESVDVAEEVREAVVLFQQRAEAKGINLQVDAGETVASRSRSAMTQRTCGWLSRIRGSASARRFCRSCSTHSSRSRWASAASTRASGWGLL